MTGPFPDVTFAQLEYFREVAGTGSLTAAARRLHVAQSSLSRTVAVLERRFGTTLLDRAARGVTLTPSGRAFLDTVEGILDARTAGLEGFRRFGAGEAGAVHVATLPSMVAHALGRTVARFRRARPEVRLSIVDGPAVEIVDQVAGGRADLGIADRSGGTAALRAEPLLEEPVLLVLPRGHRWQGRRSVSWPELCGETLIVPGPGSSVRLLVEAGLRSIVTDPRTDEPAPPVDDDRPGPGPPAPPPVFEVRQLVTVGPLVAAGLGVAPLPRSTVACLVPHDGLVGVPLDRPVLHRRLHLLSRTDRPLTPAAEVFAELLRADVAAVAGGR